MTGNPRPVPTATYRLQVNADFGFAQVGEQADYLERLGVSHAYLSPILQPVAGSTHGYDVVDHGSLNEQAGGRAAFDAMVATLHGEDLRVVVDVVPNHMAVPTPEHLNAPLWSVLRKGPGSAYAGWFDIDWAAGQDRVLMPVLGSSLEDALAEGQLELATDGGPGGDETVVRYYEHELPVCEGTADLPLEQLVRGQWWRLAHWQAATTELNYRRFFDVTSLIAVRVEDAEVFDRTHELLLALMREGAVDGLRIDHPDGLADPRGYLRRLAAATDDAWVVVEKIIEGDETLPSDWPCAGTTGYDALWRVAGVFVDPAGREPLTDLLATVSGKRRTLAETVTTAKQEVVASGQAAEVLRLLRLLTTISASAAAPTHPSVESLRRALSALIVAMDRYRAYVVPGEPATAESVMVLDAACGRAVALLDEGDHATLDLVRDVALGRVGAELAAQVGPQVAELVVRFQQTCGPVMAKGIEDTAFYRWHRLVGLNEVGGDPDHFAVSPDELHAFAARTAAAWPTTMTTLSTHDTKRAEDVRARLAVLSERPHEWQTWLRRAQELARPHRSSELDGSTEYLLWQTLVGTWPVSVERLDAYARKAVREAKQHTSWVGVDETYERSVADFVTGVLGDRAVVAHVEEWVAAAAAPARVTTLGQKLLQLVMPGVPDVYQGAELVDLSLVDPDNRRPVDYAQRRTRLARLDAGEAPADLDDEKLLVTSRTLRLRRDHPEWFVGEEATRTRVCTTSDHALAVGRGDATGVHAVAVVTRLGASLGSWGDATVALPPGQWVDVLSGARVTAESPVPLAGLLTSLPVALLVKADG